MRMRAYPIYLYGYQNIQSRNRLEEIIKESIRSFEVVLTWVVGNETTESGSASPNSASSVTQKPGVQRLDQSGIKESSRTLLSALGWKPSEAWIQAKPMELCKEMADAASISSFLASKMLDTKAKQEELSASILSINGYDEDNVGFAIIQQSDDQAYGVGLLGSWEHHVRVDRTRNVDPRESSCEQFAAEKLILDVFNEKFCKRLKTSQDDNEVDQGHRQIADAEIIQNNSLVLDYTTLKRPTFEDMIQTLVNGAQLAPSNSPSSHPASILGETKNQVSLSAMNLESMQNASVAVSLPRPPRLIWLQGKRLSHYADTTGWALVSGSYNPLHFGHRAMAKATSQMLDASVQVAFELSVLNADKASLVNPQDIGNRVLQFKSDDYPVVLTREALFVKKVYATHAAYFTVGFDTAIRILEPKYYGGKESMLETLVELYRRSNVRILVAGRIRDPKTNQGEFMTLEKIDVPLELNSMFVGIPEQVFRVDISSTILRNQKGDQNDYLKN